MFVCNFKMNKGLIKKLSIVFLIIFFLIVFFVVAKRFHSSILSFKVNDDVKPTYLEINTNNYTSFLKDSHENIDNYVGKKIKFTGFVYRLYDFNQTQFVLAREMIISSDNHAVVVGFLCDYENANNFDDGCWVEAEGTIEKGNYHGDLPVLKIKNLKKVTEPYDKYVFPPDDCFIPESV